MESKKFNQRDYIQQWQRENMKTINTRYKADFVDSFKQACADLGVSQSEVFREAMQETIKKAKKKAG